MILGFDIDEVVSLTVDRTISYIKDKSGIELNRKDQTMYEFREHPLLQGETALLEELYIQFKHPSLDFYMECTPDPQGVEILNKLSTLGHLIYFITSRPVGAERKTASWLKKYNIPFDHIQHVGKSIFKGKACSELNLDFYIDDYEKCIESILAYKKKFPLGIAIFDKPWNQHYFNENVLRIRGWDELFLKLQD